MSDDFDCLDITKSVSTIEEVLQKFERVDSAREVMKKRLVLQRPHEEEILHNSTAALSQSGGLESETTQSEGGTLTAAGGVRSDAATAANTSTLAHADAAAVKADAATFDSETIDLDSYLLQVDQLMDLERYFADHQRFQSAGHTLGDLSDLIRAASDHIYQFYDEILRSNSSPLGIVPSLSEGVQIKRGSENLLPPESSVPALCLDKQGILQLMPEAAIRDLLKLMKRLQLQQSARSSGSSDKSYLQLYVDRRAQFLQHTLQNAFNETSILRGTVAASATAASAMSPSMNSAGSSGGATEGSESKGVVGSVVGGTGKILASMLNAEKVEQRKRDREFLESASSYQKGSHLFLLYLETLLVLCRSERALTETLVGSAASGKSHLAVYAKIVGPAVQQWAELGDALLKSLKRNPNRVYGVSVMLDVYGTLQQLLTLFEDVFAGCPASADELTGINSFWNKLTTAARSVFSQFRDDVKADAMRQLPSDGTVAELTSLSLNFLRHLFHYKDVLADVLPSAGSSSEKSSSSSKRGPLGDYIITVLSNVKENLEEKARKEKNRVLANMFLLNNFHFILKNVEGNNNLLGSEVGTRAVQAYRGWVDEQREAYRTSLDPLTDYLNEDKYRDKLKDTSKSFGSKEKTVLKGRFSGFNKDFEETFEAQSRLYVPDEGLRTELRRELRARILPAYRSFLDRWGDGAFTKSPGKYIKFSAESLEAMVNKFFDGAVSNKK